MSQSWFEVLVSFMRSHGAALKALRLVLMGGHTPAEAAVACGCSVARVRAVLKRAERAMTHIKRVVHVLKRNAQPGRLPKSTFESLARLIRSSGASRRAAKRVLVDDVPLHEAASEVGVTRQACWNVVRRFCRAMQTLNALPPPMLQ